MKRLSNKTVIFTKTEINRIINLYTKKNEGLIAIGKTFGVTPGTIRKTLVANGCKIRRRGRPALVS